MQVFLDFIVSAVTCVLRSDLIATDMKLQNIVYKPHCKENKQAAVMTQFRLVDVDGIETIALPADSHSPTFDPDILADDRRHVSTFPVIHASLLRCPTLLIIQTWYACVVTILDYYALYTANAELHDAIWTQLYWKGFGPYNHERYGILSAQHPLLKLLQVHNVPSELKTEIQKYVDVIQSLDTQNQLYSCIPFYTPKQKQIEHEEYAEYRTITHLLRDGTIRNLENIQEAGLLPTSTYSFFSHIISSIFN